MSIKGGPGSNFFGTGQLVQMTTTSGGGGSSYLTPDDSSLLVFYRFLPSDICGNKLGNYASGSLVYDGSLNGGAVSSTSNSFSTGRSYIVLDNTTNTISTMKYIRLPNGNGNTSGNKIPQFVTNQTPYTYCFWMKSSSCSSTRTPMFFIGNNGGAHFTDQYNNQPLGSPLDNGSGIAIINNGIGALSLEKSTNIFQDGLWHHYAFILNIGHMNQSLYIDGSLRGHTLRPNNSYNLDSLPPSFVHTLGAPNLPGHPWYSGPTTFINGGFGDVRIYGRCLNAVEIYNLYNKGTIAPLTLYASPSISQYEYISTTIFTYTGANQSVTIPNGANHMIVKCWGAGGASRNVNMSNGYVVSAAGGVSLSPYGGAGGYTTAVFPVQSQNNYNVIVGGAGKVGSSFSTTDVTAAFGGGGISSVWGSMWTANTGGGRSALQYNSEDIITAGGGGSAGLTTVGQYGSVINVNGGNGGGITGGNGTMNSVATTRNYIGMGGTQTAGGAGYSAGSKYTGGNGNSGGGGGYYGGGAGGYSSGDIYNPSSTFYAAGGGSSYIDNTALVLSSYTNTMLQGGTLGTGIVANNDELPSAYFNKIGNGGFECFSYSNSSNYSFSNHAQPGLVIISFFT